MSKENPERFDGLVDFNFDWVGGGNQPKDWKNVEYLKQVGKYYLYFAWENVKEMGHLYRTEIIPTCDKCGQELKE